MSLITKELGVVDLIFNKINLGNTSGGAKWTIEIDEKEIMKDQLGTKPADLIRTGKLHKIITSLAEPDIENMCLTDNCFVTTDSNLSMNFDAALFQAASDEIHTLVLRDINDATSDGKISFYAARPKFTGEISYGPDQQKLHGLEFSCFRDDDNDSFGYFGDPGSLGLDSIDGE